MCPLFLRPKWHLMHYHLLSKNYFVPIFCFIFAQIDQFVFVSTLCRIRLLGLSSRIFIRTILLRTNVFVSLKGYKNISSNLIVVNSYFFHSYIYCEHFLLFIQRALHVESLLIGFLSKQMSSKNSPEYSLEHSSEYVVQQA